jgi:endonuclease/exonuclease/phosphatase family metal-dependent hydrolase
MRYLKIVIVSVIVIASALFALIYWAHLPGDIKPAYHFNGQAARTDRPSELKVATYNIAYGRGVADSIVVGRQDETAIRKNLDGIAELLRDASIDIAFLQEVDLSAKRSYFIDEAKHIAEKGGYPSYACVADWAKNYLPFPYWPPSKHFGRLVSGICILSKFPIVSNERIALPGRSDKPLYYRAFYMEHAIQSAVVDLGGIPMRLFNVHEEAYNSKTREEQARVLASSVNGGKMEMTIVAGDFNSLPIDASKKKNFLFRPDSQWTEGDDYLKDRSLAIFAEQTPWLADALAGKGPEGDYFTYPSDIPDRRLDFIFHSRALGLADSGMVREAGALSDHLPIYAVVLP